MREASRGQTRSLEKKNEKMDIFTSRKKVFIQRRMKLILRPTC